MAEASTGELEGALFSLVSASQGSMLYMHLLILCGYNWFSGTLKLAYMGTRALSFHYSSFSLALLHDAGSHVAVKRPVEVTRLRSLENIEV